MHKKERGGKKREKIVPPFFHTFCFRSIAMHSMKRGREVKDK
jgi:hypothetical protein